MINVTAEQNKESHKDTKSVDFKKAKLQDLFQYGLNCCIYSINIHLIPDCLPSR